MEQCLATKDGHETIITKSRKNCEEKCDYFEECYASVLEKEATE